MKKLLLAAVAVLSAAAAHAQATTNCVRNGPYINCQTNEPPRPQINSGNLFTGMLLYSIIEEQRRAAAERARLKQEEQLQEQLRSLANQLHGGMPKVGVDY